MKEILIRLLGGATKSEVGEIQSDWKNKLLVKDAELTTLRSQKAKEHPILDVNIGDPSPSDHEKRKLYVSQVAGFHKDYLAPKLKQIITTLRGDFEKVNRNTFGLPQHEYDLYLKGAINALWLLDEWGEEMINEQIAYQQGLSDEETQELKDKLK
jgi:hypothetical protein